jgi:hypothetical protein
MALFDGAVRRLRQEKVLLGADHRPGPFRPWRRREYLRRVPTRGTTAHPCQI